MCRASLKVPGVDVNTIFFEFVALGDTFEVSRAVERGANVNATIGQHR